LKLKTLVIAAAMMPLFAVAQEERLAFGSTNAQSAYYAYFAALAKVVNNTYPNKYQAQVVETGRTIPKS